jgi:hypothetical protein
MGDLECGLWIEVMPAALEASYSWGPQRRLFFDSLLLLRRGHTIARPPMTRAGCKGRSWRAVAVGRLYKARAGGERRRFD